MFREINVQENGRCASGSSRKRGFWKLAIVFGLGFVSLGLLANSASASQSDSHGEVRKDGITHFDTVREVTVEGTEIGWQFSSDVPYGNTEVCVTAVGELFKPLGDWVPFTNSGELKKLASKVPVGTKFRFAARRGGEIQPTSKEAEHFNCIIVWDITF